MMSAYVLSSEPSLQPTDPASRLPLDTISERFGLEYLASTNGRTTWRGPGIHLSFFDQSRRLEFNDGLLWLNGAVSTNASGQRIISETDLVMLLVPLLSDWRPPAANTPFHVVLDPGHGGTDPGAVVSHLPPEKALNLDIAKRVEKILTAQGLEVKLTRSDDRFLSLNERTDLAQQHQASIFVSIHANKASSPSAQGIETFVLPAAGFPSTSSSIPEETVYPGNEHDAASSLLSWYIHTAMITQTEAVDRGIKRARYEVLKNTPCPAVLVETGFMSNAAEQRKFRNPRYRQKLSDAIASGILDYKRHLKPEAVTKPPTPLRKDPDDGVPDQDT